MQIVFGGHETQWMCLRGVVAPIRALALCGSALILLSWAVSAAIPQLQQELMTGVCLLVTGARWQVPFGDRLVGGGSVTGQCGRLSSMTGTGLATSIRCRDRRQDRGRGREFSTNGAICHCPEQVTS